MKIQSLNEIYLFERVPKAKNYGSFFAMFLSFGIGLSAASHACLRKTLAKAWAFRYYPARGRHLSILNTKG